MTTKINGIDVSECPHYDKVVGCFHTFEGECIKDKCSIYKLILKNQCLQEENKELRQTRKNSPDIQEPYIYLYRQIKKQCHKLEVENEELKKQLNIYMSQYEIKIPNKYRQALEEIREIAKFNQFYNPEKFLINGNIGQIQDLKMTEIYNKINEALNDRN